MPIIFLNPGKVTDDLVSAMEQYMLLLLARFPVAHLTVTADWSPGTGHVADSQHYLGKAVDFNVGGVPLLDAWLTLERVPSIRGIGLYPDWAHPGLHADVRNNTTYRARWWRDGAVYKDVSQSTLADFVNRFAKPVAQ